ncbi:MAG: CBS domain-containing protein [Planctomycetota bacterium]
MIDVDRLSAQDMMKTDLISLNVRSTLTEAVRMFEENGVSGAPVVNDTGDLVGVISLTDVARSEHFKTERFDGRATQSVYEYDPLLDLRPDELADEGIELPSLDYDQEGLDLETVESWMTARIVSVSPETTLPELCRIMADESIHRVFVASNGRLQGVVTTFDIVKAIGSR